MKKINVSLIIISLTLILPIAPVYADGSNMVAQYLTNLGKAYYDEGDFVSAIHEFSKAVMIAPNNALAQDYLKRFGVSGGYYARSESQISHVSRLSRYLEKYKKQVETLEKIKKKQGRINDALVEDKVELKQVISNKAVENRDLRKEIKAFEQKVEEEIAQRNKVLEESEKKNHKIARLSDDLFHNKERLSDAIAEARYKGKVLKKNAKEHKQALYASQRKTRVVKADYEDQVFDLEREFRQFKQEAAALEADRKQKIEKLEDIIRKKRIELGFLNDRVLFSDYKLSGRDQQMTSKNQQIANLKETIKTYENEIKILRAKKWDKRTIEKYIKERQSKKQQEMVKYVKRQDRLIADLKQKLISARLEIDSLGEGKGPVDTAKVAELQQQLADVRLELQKKAVMMKERGEEYAALQERLKETEDRLELVQRIMDDKDVQIEELENQLTGVLSQFED